MLSSLVPLSLLALVFALPVLSAPTSPNDPFHAISLQAPKRPEHPICCLRPLEPVEPSPREDVFISFEDWKARRLGEAGEQPSGPPSSASNTQKSSRPNNSASDPTGAEHASSSDQLHDAAQANIPQDAIDSSHVDERLSPHFRIPTLDRFNYASTDCSARVHNAHRSAKSPSSILSSKKDRYMLSPCAEKKQFVVVELCDDIMIDTVQLANYEFFSGVFKDFSVSVAKTYTPDEEGWTHAGTYRAQNVRGVQSFHLPPTLRDFYRVIRIDFHSHYGSEYYCPLSLLRVYGLTHLEQWKWDEWESQSKARRAVEDLRAHVSVSLDPPQTVHAPNMEALKLEEVAAGMKYEVEGSGTAATAQAAVTTAHGLDSSAVGRQSLLEPQDPQEVPSVLDTIAQLSIRSDCLSMAEMAYISTRTDDGDDASIGLPRTIPVHTSKSTPTISSFSAATQASSSRPQPSSSHASPNDTPISSEGSHSYLSSQSLSAALSSSFSSLLSPSVSAAASHSPPPPVAAFPPATTGGESIYRTIMNRLAALEANTTLYARYVEEQTAGIREVLLRLGEDIGRLEGIGKAQAQMYQRSVSEFDRQRRRLDWEQRELLVKVDHLTDEVILEKRLGILQLCLLLAVLVFMTLTRGSRGEHVHRVHGLSHPLSMRDWGRRTLSLSGDWVNRFKSRSPTPKPVAHETRPAKETAAAAQVEFPSHGAQTPSHRAYPNKSPKSPTFPRLATRHLTSRPRTPSALRASTPRYQNVHARGTPSTPPLSSSERPRMSRSTSSSAGLGDGLSSAMPRSAKRWARTAHLHEVKSAAAVLTRGTESAQSQKEHQKIIDVVHGSGSASSSRTALVRSGDAAATDVFSSRSETVLTPTASKGKGKLSRPTLSPLRLSTSSDLPRLCVASAPSSDADGAEGDAWVDTDADGSESESGLVTAAAITPSSTRQAVTAM